MLTYAEVHYRLPFFPSLIAMKMPEIICDAPSRIHPGRPVPLFLFIKDADRFPVKLLSFTVQIIYENGIEKVARFPYSETAVSEPFWWDAVNFVPEHSGILRIIPTLALKIGGKERLITIDNYKGSAKTPLLVNVAEDARPSVNGWFHGDIHVHTLMTSDQVEFGAPVEALALAAFSMGLHWFAAADHSYDLDDEPDNYLKRDPQLKKWLHSRYVADLLASTFTVIAGEEVSCRTSEGRTCHMLSLNSGRFIPGSGDSGEPPLKTRSEHTVGEAASTCVEWGGVAIAAHPLEKVPLAEKLLLNRGQWTRDDLSNPGICGIQIYNGVRDRGYRDGKKYWISQLLDGRRIPISGGSDAHGDLNRQRAVSIPFLSVTDRPEHSFASVRTVVRAASAKRQDIVEAIRAGHSVVSDGPFIELAVFSEKATAGPGDILKNDSLSVSALCLSSRDFGELTSARIIAGPRGGTETMLAEIYDFNDPHAHKLDNVRVPRDAAYVRAECETGLGKLCLTNPVWLDEK